MKAIMVMYDSLNRRYLPPYGNAWVHAPNFTRLAQRAVTFESSYIGSMPCMPARREWHTGRPNFLHRSWGPIEPYDDSAPDLLKSAGVYTHLATDHYHYWEDGGAGYATRYNTYEFFRGQEGDPFLGQVAHPDIPDAVAGKARAGAPHWRQDWINRAHMRREEDMPQSQTFRASLDFIRRNAREDNWFLHLETFDPHEPFFVPRRYRDLYPNDYAGPHFDWPTYTRVTESPEQVLHVQRNYAALVSMCDASLGELLDTMDELDLWRDTMLIVWTDHGFLLGEHGWWAKMAMPWYEELARTPFFVWDPRCGKKNERRRSLVQPALDLGATLLEYFNVPRPADMIGKPLRETIASDAPVHEGVLFGAFGSQVNVTDGRHVYMRGPAEGDQTPVYRYWLEPAHMRAPFTPAEILDAKLAGPFRFTKGVRVVRTRQAGHWGPKSGDMRTTLYDLQTDPGQHHPIDDAAVEARMAALMTRLMAEADAPAEQFVRLGLTPPEGLSVTGCAADPSAPPSSPAILDCRHLSQNPPPKTT